MTPFPEGDSNIRRPRLSALTVLAPPLLVHRPVSRQPARPGDTAPQDTPPAYLVPPARDRCPSGSSCRWWPSSTGGPAAAASPDPCCGTSRTGWRSIAPPPDRAGHPDPRLARRSFRTIPSTRSSRPFRSAVSAWLRPSAHQSERGPHLHRSSCDLRSLMPSIHLSFMPSLYDMYCIVPLYREISKPARFQALSSTVS